MGVERDPSLADLAGKNALANGWRGLSVHRRIRGSNARCRAVRPRLRQPALSPVRRHALANAGPGGCQARARRSPGGLGRAPRRTDSTGRNAHIGGAGRLPACLHRGARSGAVRLGCPDAALATAGPSRRNWSSARREVRKRTIPDPLRASSCTGMGAATPNRRKPFYGMDCRSGGERALPPGQVSPRSGWRRYRAAHGLPTRLSMLRPWSRPGSAAGA